MHVLGGSYDKLAGTRNFQQVLGEHGCPLQAPACQELCQGCPGQSMSKVALLSPRTMFGVVVEFVLLYLPLSAQVMQLLLHSVEAHEQQLQVSEHPWGTCS